MEFSKTLKLLCVVLAWLTSCLQADEVQFKGRMITLRDFGADDLAYLVLPDVAPKAGILLVPHQQGLVSEIKSFSDTLAKNGYIVVAVDLHNGQTSTDEETITAMRSALRVETATKIMEAGLTLLNESPRWRAPHAIVLALGQNAGLTLNLKWQESIVGMTWLEPRGEWDERLFRRCPMPLQVITTDEESKEFNRKLSEKLHPRRAPITFSQNYKTPALWLASNADRSKSQRVMMNFWSECIAGKHAAPRSAFEKWVKSIVD